MTGTFDESLDQVERALKIISTIENNPELQNKTFDLLFGRAAPPARNEQKTDAATRGAAPDDPGTGNGGGKARATPRRATKPSSVTVDKSLDTTPQDVIAWKTFAEEKKPTSQPDRNTTAVYWLKEVAGHEKVNTAKVFTLYLDVNWKPPSDPKNSLQVTASQTGLIDTADMEDIKVTPRGMGRVKTDLPLPGKK